MIYMGRSWKLLQFKSQKVRQSFTFRGRIASQNFVHQLFSIDSRCLSLLRSVLSLSSSCCTVRLSLDDKGRPSLHWLPKKQCKRSRNIESIDLTSSLMSYNNSKDFVVNNSHCFYAQQEYEVQKSQAARRGIPIRWQKMLFTRRMFKNFNRVGSLHGQKHLKCPDEI